MNCERCRNSLLDYHHHELADKDLHRISMHIDQCATCKEEYFELSRTLDDFRKEANGIESSDLLVDRVETQLPKQQSPRPPINWKQSLSIFSIILVSAFIIAMFTSGKFYYWVLDFTPINYDHLDRTIAEGYGEDLQLIEVDDNLRISITEVVADELATQVYYEIEDLSKEHLYSFQNTYDFNITNAADVWPESYSEQEHYRIVQSHTYLPHDEDYILKGRIEFMPIEVSEAELDLVIGSLFQIPEKDDIQHGDPYRGQHMDLTEGNWTFSIPVSKSSVREYDLFDQQTEVEGVAFNFHQLKVGPTKTLLKFTQHGQSHKQGQSIHYYGLSPTALYLNDKRFDYPNLFNNGYYHGQLNDTFQRVEFDSIFFENIDQLSFQFENANRNVQDRTEIDLEDGSVDFPYEMNLQDISFTINKTEKNDETISFVINDDYFPGRTHESIHIYPINGNHDQITSHNQETLIIDEHGDKHDYLTEYHMAMLDNPRMYTTKYEFGLKANDGEKLENTQLIIDGYTETIELDHQVEIEQIEIISSE